jgi:hypothetical protein
LAKKYKGRLELLPHAAADTEHVSRVEGAKQAVDQLFDAIINRRVTNLKGDLPEGYVSAGACTVPGVGRATVADIEKVAATDDAAELRNLSESMAAIWGALNSSQPALRKVQAGRHAKELMLSFNRYVTLMKRLGLEGPLDQ